MDRAEKIAAIRARRAENATRTEAIGTHLADVETALLTLERVRADLLDRVGEEPRERLSALGPGLRDLADKIALERAAVDRALARLRRGTLNIGVVGRARQGKSRLLQSLTGLTNREIPDGSGRFCTGVPSTIRHFDGQTYADVYYHSERSFVDEVVGLYYDRYGLGARPVSPRAFGASPLPSLPPDRASNPQAESAYGHLRAYHDAFPEYGPLIGRASPERVGDDRIRSFVAQDDPDGNPLHAFRAVRRVEISTKFHQSDLTGIAVIDLPGLGDTNLGDSRVLLAALEDDVDLVLFVRRPNPEGDGIHEVDVDLYGIAQSALPEIAMERRSFMILNHRASVDQDNLANAKSFAADLEKSPIRVAGVHITDCSKPEQVIAAFDPIVDYLLTTIDSLDETIISERVRRRGEIDQEVRLLIEQSSFVHQFAQPGDMSKLVFQELFRQTYENLAGALEDLVGEFRAERDAPETKLGEAVAAVLARARIDDGIPAADQIARRRNVEGSNIKAFSGLMDEARSHLSRQFLELDESLNETVTHMWARLATALRDPGELGHLSAQEGRAFLADLSGQIGQVRLHGPSEIRYALDIVLNFGLSYRGFFQHRIRPCLDGMSADNPETVRPDGDSSPKDVREYLDIAYQEALYRCEEALSGLLSEPNSAVFAIVEEFRDRVLRSRRTAEEWDALYWRHRSDVWSGEFDALAAETVHLQMWNEAIERLNTML
ncbi:hypothetical protein Acor_63370 [Acrocarpospora corrugata]|uniref:Dynamin family protein n=1 Tax=Acrocarpospora corrugata TaxID=35763 RepID=A0A5M3W7D5_9ACTN|nr:GTPase domain-containing protein [Acrocarpospora corrugata]GES04269.1 hypothetical protein Acor_63370 [Acrocarpospora corrugata]